MYRVVPQKVTKPCPQPLDVSYSLSTVVGRNHGGIGVPRNATSHQLAHVPNFRAREMAGVNNSHKSKMLQFSGAFKANVLIALKKRAFKLFVECILSHRKT